MSKSSRLVLAAVLLAAAFGSTASAQIGTRFPSEKKIVADPVTGVPVTFLTSTEGKGDSKIYQTHHQWTADGKWVVFRSSRVPGQAMAVNEETGEIVQVTDKGFSGMLCLADNSMNLYFLRTAAQAQGRGRGPTADTAPVAATAAPAAATADAATTATPADGTAATGRRGAGRGAGRGPAGPAQIVRVDLGKLFADVAANKVGPADTYEKVCGTIPVEWGAGGDMAIDCTEDFAYFRVSTNEAAKHLPADTKIEGAFGPRSMGAGPTGLGKMNLKTGEVGYIVSVPFQIGHVQTNPWMPGEIVFCWETGGKAPQRTWTVMADGTGLRPLFPEAPYDWITHEAVITKDEVAIAMLAHRRVGTPETADWGATGTGEHPTGLGIVNLRTREMRIVGQIPEGDRGRSVWHVNGSPDGRWAVADDFQYRLWLIDRKSGETKLLADLGHKTGAQDHIHPTFNADSTKIEVQTAMLSEDGRSLNIAIVPVPESWLKRKYTDTFEVSSAAPQNSANLFADASAAPRSTTFGAIAPQNSTNNPGSTMSTNTPISNANASDVQAVKDAVAEFYRALNVMFTGDLEPMKKVWSHADDVTYMGPGGGFQVGWSQTLPVWESQAAMKLGGKVEPQGMRITVGRDLAIVSDVETGENKGPDGKMSSVSIRATNIFRKENGVWKMIGHHTDLLPNLVK